MMFHCNRIRTEDKSCLLYIENYIRCGSLIYGNLLDLGTAMLQPQIIKKFSEIKKTIEIDESTLILLDIDNTLLTPVGDCGTVEHFVHLFKTEMATKQCSEIEARIAIYERWIRAHGFIKTKVVDDNIQAFIKAAKMDNAVVLAFTARLPRMKEVTLEQLKQHDIRLDQLPEMTFSKTYQLTFDLSLTPCHQTTNIVKFPDVEQWQAQTLFASGVVFCHDLNTKGMVLKDFFETLKLYRYNKGLADIKKIIFVDDGAYNFESMYQAASEFGIDFYGFHFQYQNNFDAVRAANEEQSLAGLNGLIN